MWYVLEIIIQILYLQEKEAEEWAADFNLMCEEIEEFPLMVE